MKPIVGGVTSMNGCFIRPRIVMMTDGHVTDSNQLEGCDVVPIDMATAAETPSMSNNQV